MTSVEAGLDGGSLPGASSREVLSQTAHLTRARWRIAVSGLRAGARWRRATYLAVAAALAFLSLVALLVSFVLTRGIAELTAPAVGKADVVVAMTLTGVLSLCVLVSFTVALAALYLAADLDLLLSAPISRRAVFASKLISGLLPADAVLVLLAVVPLLGHGLAMGYGVEYYAAAGAALLMLPLLPAAVGASAVMIIVRRVSAHRLGDVVALIIGAMTLSIAFLAGGAQQLQEAITTAELIGAFERLRSPFSPAEWLTRGITAFARQDAGGGAVWLGLAGATSLLALAGLAILARRLYFAGWEQMRSSDRRREMRRSRLPWNRVDNAAMLARPSGLLSRLSPGTVAIMRKDFRAIPRDLTSMAQVLSPLSIGVFFVLQRLLYPVQMRGIVAFPGMLQPLLIMLSAGIAAAVSAMILSRFCLTGFSIEGRTYWMLKSAPVSRHELVIAKFLVAYLPYLGLGAALLVLLELARAFADARVAGGPLLASTAAGIHPGLLLYAWFVVATVGAGVLAINLALGVARPNLRWDTPHEMLTPDVGCLSLVTYGAYGFVAGFALVVPAATVGFPLLGNPLPMWLLGLGIGLGSTVFVLVGSYRLAVSELATLAD